MDLAVYRFFINHASDTIVPQPPVFRQISRSKRDPRATLAPRSRRDHQFPVAHRFSRRHA
jgi:hypothetical protein